jgi:squalene-associated FAD-dependent desaturase
MSRRSVVVVGGGLAGLTAALDCADAGLEVTLLEARPRLGGLTFSFRHGDLDADNGQHVFLRCCTAYLGLLDRLGVADRVALQDRLDVPVRSARGGKTRRLRRSRLPAPAHIALSLASYSFVPGAARARAGLTALALKRLDPLDAATDRQAFGPWLARHGQDEAAVEALWDLIGLATLNVRAPDASLALAATVFQIGLLGRADAADIGWSRVPLSQLHAEPAAAALAERGAQVRLGARVRGLRPPGDPAAERWLVDFDAAAGRDSLAADAVILAVPPEAADALLPPDSVDLPVGWARRLGESPIVNAHAVFERQVLDEPLLAVLDSPLQWIFDRTPGHMRNAGGQYLVMSFSAADDLIDRPTADLRELLTGELMRVLPAARGAGLSDFFVTRERHATFRAAPGVAAFRPPARTKHVGLSLAGSWTATDWPATMEGAVRSGHSAAHAVLGLPAARQAPASSAAMIESESDPVREAAGH